MKNSNTKVASTRTPQRTPSTPARPRTKKAIADILREPTTPKRTRKAIGALAKNSTRERPTRQRYVDDLYQHLGKAVTELLETKNGTAQPIRIALLRMIDQAMAAALAAKIGMIMRRAARTGKKVGSDEEEAHGITRLLLDHPELCSRRAASHFADKALRIHGGWTSEDAALAVELLGDDGLIAFSMVATNYRPMSEKIERLDKFIKRGVQRIRTARKIGPRPERWKQVGTDYFFEPKV